MQASSPASAPVDWASRDLVYSSQIKESWLGANDNFSADKDSKTFEKRLKELVKTVFHDSYREELALYYLNQKSEMKIDSSLSKIKKQEMLSNIQKLIKRFLQQKKISSQTLVTPYIDLYKSLLEER